MRFKKGIWRNLWFVHKRISPVPKLVRRPLYLHLETTQPFILNRGQQQVEQPSRWQPVLFTAIRRAQLFQGSALMAVPR